MSDNNPHFAMTRHVHFVTGKLAEHALRQVAEQLAKTHGFAYSIGVMPITVAALMTSRWLLRHLHVPAEATEVWLPGYLGEPSPELRLASPVPLHVGPRDLRDLPEIFSGKKSQPPDLSRHSLEIIAEINHAPRIVISELVTTAQRLSSAGADVIDLGCTPGETWSTVSSAVATLVKEGLRVSIDSFDPQEVEHACQAGAELVLSVNSSNAALAKHWGVEVVAIPDSPRDLDSLARTIEILERDGVRYRLDPILEPIGCGCADSLMRYYEVRRRYPNAAMMMGVGNLTELTDVDSAGINMLLIGLCAELRVGSVLTTQVINWARTAVAECDRARRLADYAVRNGVPPKRLDDALVMLRDARLTQYPTDTFEQLAASIRDPNFRLFADEEQLHMVTAGLHISGRDPFELFDRMMTHQDAPPVDSSHAFYLGFELCKAAIARQLGKRYEQDRALRWGLLTIEEPTHRLQRRSAKSTPPD